MKIRRRALDTGGVPMDSIARRSARPIYQRLIGDYR